MPRENTREIDEIMRENPSIGGGKDKAPFVSNHTGYRPGGENYEHDDTGGKMNYSGVMDDVNEALKEHEDWQEGYDY